MRSSEPSAASYCLRESSRALLWPLFVPFDVDAPNDRLEIGLLQAHVFDPISLTRLPHEKIGPLPVAIEAKPRDGILDSGKLGPFEFGMRDRLAETHDERAETPVLALDTIDVAVIDQGAVIDQHDAPAEPLHVREVVSRQNDRRFPLGIDPRDELANRLLRHDVEPDGRLVQVDDARAVQECRRKIPAHPLAQRQLAHRGTQKILHLEDLDELSEVLAIAIGRNPVDRAQELERLDERKVPIELAALAEDHADVARVLLTALPGDQAGDADLTGGGNENAGEHLDGRGFAGAVRADVADQLAGLERERDAADGAALLVFAREKGAQRTEGSRRALRRAKDLPEVARFYDRQDTA